MANSAALSSSDLHRLQGICFGQQGWKGLIGQITFEQLLPCLLPRLQKLHRVGVNCQHVKLCYRLNVWVTAVFLSSFEADNSN